MNDNNIENIENVNNIGNHTEGTTENIIVHEFDNSVSLGTIHNDLGIIISFLSFAAVLILCILVYKFFRIFF